MKAGTADVVDLYAGGGGTSTGVALACKKLGLDVNLTAINHWPEAVETHKANHPWAKHLCMEVEQAIPREVVPGGRLDLLVASPSCVYHSRAAGGRPKKEQERASPWHILRWLEELDVDSLLVENVPEFSGWGALDGEGRPIKELRGTTYRAWFSAIESLGYTAEARVLNAADYGAPTSRSRIFIAARKGRGVTIRWPKPTHSQDGKGKRKWRAAKSIIDWSLEGNSIFGRKKDLSPNTIRRIIEGLKRFGGEGLQPFIIQMEHGGSPVDEPLKTIDTSNRMGLARPFLLPVRGYFGKNTPKSVEAPLGTITQRGYGGVVKPCIIRLTDAAQVRGSSRSIEEEPVPSLATNNHVALAEGCLVQYNGNSKAQSVNDPVPTIPTKERFALVRPVVDGQMLDIKFRMLQDYELAAAMQFPKGYVFVGTKTQRIKQIGNAVVVGMAYKLARGLLEN